jgi:hypothetical protein
MSICDIDDEPCDEAAQIEAVVEAIGNQVFQCAF